MSEWPVWYPGLELRSAHLLGLESFLLERGNLDRFAHGVEELDVRRHIQTERDANGLRVRVAGVRGLTPTGQPVVVVEPAPIDAVIAAAPAPTYHVDLWIEVNAPDARDGKLALRGAAVPANSAPFDVAAHPNTLYLGRYRIHQLDRPHLIARPVVRTLAACRPHDESWAQWVRPIADAIRAAYGYADTRPRNGLAAQALQNEVARLVYDWPTTPIHILAARLDYVRWLKRVASASTAMPEPIMTSPAFPPAAATGDAIPRLLAATLEPGAGAPVGAVLGAVLDRVYLRVPLPAFRQWRAWIAQPDLVTDIDALVRAIEARPRLERFERWTRAIGLITMHAFHKNDSVRWKPATIAQYLKGTNATRLDEGVAHAMDQLFACEGSQWPAGPLGFHEVASAAVHSADIVAACSQPVRAYLAGLLRPSGDLAAAASANRVLAFAGDRQGEHRETVHRIDGMQLVGRSRRATANEVDLKVAILGGPGAGKTSLMRALHRASTDGSAPALAARVTFRPHLRLDSGTDSPGPHAAIERFEARLDQGAGSIGRMTITEIPADAIASPDEAVSATLSAADVVVLALDPASLDRSERPLSWFSAVESALGPALRGRPDVLVCIAFTRADEYGTVDPRSLRLFSRLEDIVLLERLRDAAPGLTDGAYRQLVESVTLPGRGSDAWGETRRRLLDQTRELWIGLVRGLQHLGVNGYFVTAEPVDAYYQPWARRGVLQLFADALAVAGLTAPQPAFAANESDHSRHVAAWGSAI